MLDDLKKELIEKAEYAEGIASVANNKIFETVYKVEAITLRNVLELIDSKKYTDPFIAALRLTKEWNKEIMASRAKIEELMSHRKRSQAEKLQLYVNELYYRREQLLDALTLDKHEPEKFQVDGD